MESTIEQLDSLFKGGFVNGILTILFYIIVFSIANHLITKFIRQREFKHKEAVLRIKSVLLWTLLIFSVLSQITFLQDIATTLLAGGGIVAVIVGLASQEAASSAVSGMMILMSKPFKVGDTIILKEYDLRGKVTEITLSHTVIETLEKNLIMIPNTLVNKAIVENMTHETEYKIAYLSFDVSYESDLDKASEIMKEVITNHPLYYDVGEEVKIHCTELKDSGITLRARMTTRNIDDSFELCCQCRLQIKKAFDEAGIEIPYPHITLTK